MEAVSLHNGIQERFREFLEENGYRPTYVREKLLEAILTSKGAFSIEELTDSMVSERTVITLASVYNNIKLLSLFGAVTKIVVNDPVEGLVWRYRKSDV